MPSQRTWHKETFQRGNFHRTSDTIQIAGILREEMLSGIVISKCLRVVLINDKTNLKLFDADDDEIMMEWTGGTEWINLWAQEICPKYDVQQNLLPTEHEVDDEQHF